MRRHNLFRPSTSTEVYKKCLELLSLIILTISNIIIIIVGTVVIINWMLGQVN